MVASSCKKEIDPTGSNPFDGIKQAVKNIQVNNPDSSSIVGIHQYTLKRTCSLSGCHDGTFEPDFRTVQSSYSTTVYQPIIKNNPEATFDYRVKPFDPANSWLVEKITTDDPIISRMPVNLPPISKSEINAIKKWIADGAKDILGQSAVAPNEEIKYEGICAFVKYQTTDVRLDDTLRIDKVLTNPFVLPKIIKGYPFEEAEIWFLVNDQGINPTPIDKLTINEVLISENPDDFTNAQIIKAEFISSGRKINKFQVTGRDEIFYWKVKINPQEYKTKTIYYICYKVSDGVQKVPSFFPDKFYPNQAKTYSSFYVYED